MTLRELNIIDLALEQLVSRLEETVEVKKTIYADSYDSETDKYGEKETAAYRHAMDDLADARRTLNDFRDTTWGAAG